MEALTLALPLNTAGPTVSGETDGQLLKLDESAGSLDFAALLAAGLQLAQAGVSPAPAPTGHSERGTDAHDSEPTAATQLPDLPALPDGAPAVPLTVTPPPVGAHGGNAMPGPAEAAKAEVVAAGRAVLREAATDAPPLAGEAARIAAHPAEPAPLERAAETKAGPQQIELFSREAPSANAGDATVRPDVAVHGSITEPVAPRPSVHQPSALLDVEAPVAGPGFADALSRQIVWMADKDAQVAELRVNPPELGPVEVRLTLSGDTASAQFVSPHAEVRSAIESALERLRETMAQAGIQLGEASVSAESFRDQGAAQSEARDARHGYADAGASTDSRASLPAPSVRMQRGLIDLFA